MQREDLEAMNKFKLFAVAGLALALLGAGCSDADTASYNISSQADNFKILRRIVFYNGITGEYMLELTGYCSLGNDDPSGQLSVTCKTPKGYIKNFLGLSDNVTYFAEQIGEADVSPDYYNVVFKPSVIVPNLRLDVPETLPIPKVQ